jgi:predicted nucleic acid-binding protein
MKEHQGERKCQYANAGEHPQLLTTALMLIALAKMRRLDLLKAVYGDVLIGPQVKAETVDAGKRISAPAVERIEKALDDGWLQVAPLSSKEIGTAQSIVSKGGLDAGEAESLALASFRKLIVILDDRAARSFAEVIGVTFLGTAGMLFQAFVKKHLNLAELEDAVGALSQTIWLTPAVVADVLKKAREVDR